MTPARILVDFSGLGLCGPTSTLRRYFGLLPEEAPLSVAYIGWPKPPIAQEQSVRGLGSVMGATIRRVSDTLPITLRAFAETLRSDIERETVRSLGPARYPLRLSLGGLDDTLLVFPVRTMYNEARPQRTYALVVGIEQYSMRFLSMSLVLRLRSSLQRSPVA